MKSFVILISVLILQGFTFTSQKPATEGILSKEEQKLYELIMEYRKSKGLPPIALSAKLTKVAQAHARDLSENYKFDFDNKCNPHSWSKNGKWSPCCYTNDHKEAKCMWDKPREIADYAGNGYEIAYYSSKGATAEEGLTGWKASPAHNPLIVNEGIWNQVQWKAIGIGLYGEYGIVWFGEVEDDATPAPAPKQAPASKRRSS
ncbi:CAP domain-containing protein [Fulvivirgaceae bacterium PWU4]|uniref:CAP domain-containing protein n=1 Tax=Chryseosolibacter histidini TaxID=2782349 RepID=A0AAP2DHN3_9BACT|nr:CAP domain-containing protein [Chryseosolibacter histidini]MBT1696500.1 CAP domain-containing protein [Chryseosolibacter histidini]